MNRLNFFRAVLGLWISGVAALKSSPGAPLTSLFPPPLPTPVSHIYISVTGWLHLVEPVLIGSQYLYYQ